MPRFYVTTAVPTATAPPGRDFALEVVQADVLARHHGVHGDRVRFLTGVDDAVDAPDGDADAFEALRAPLALSFTDFVRTGRDARHRSGAERLWRACADAGDLRRGTGGWVFRLSRHADRLHEVIRGGALRIEPAARRALVLDLLADGLRDVAVSRPRTGDHGIPVPGDPGQVVHASWNALSGLVTGLGYGSGGPNHRRWWRDGDRRVHVVGEAALHDHALLWPAVLLSAGEPLPTDVLVHARATGVHADPADLARRYGSDAVRWWLLREAPRPSDAGLPAARLVARANRDLASTLGKLVDRVVVMVHRYRGGRPPAPAGHVPGSEGLLAACREAPEDVHEALTAFDFPRAVAVVWRIVEEGDRYLAAARPWELAHAESDGDPTAAGRLDAVLAVLLAACRTLANQLTPFLPALATRIAAQCFALSGSLARPRVLYPRLPPVAS
jgi:methionyl-tRNA synthetase